MTDYSEHDSSPDMAADAIEELQARIRDLECELAEAKAHGLIGCNACRTEPTALAGCPCDHSPCIHDYNQRVHDVALSEKRCKGLEKLLREAVDIGFGSKDWACKECRPYSGCLIKGFVCTYHAARAALATDGDEHE